IQQKQAVESVHQATTVKRRRAGMVVVFPTILESQWLRYARVACRVRSVVGGSSAACGRSEGLRPGFRGWLFGQGQDATLARAIGWRTFPRGCSNSGRCRVFPGSSPERYPAALVGPGGV